MSKKVPFSPVLGLAIGWANTHASLFGIKENRYSLVDCQKSQTSLESELDLGKGVFEALHKLEKQANYALIDGSQRIIKASRPQGKGVQQVALTTSVGEWPKTVLVGLNQKGSLRAGRLLTESMPIQLLGSFGLDALDVQASMIETLLQLHPELFILTGGEDGSNAGVIQDWIDILRIACRLLPPSLKPTILFAGNQALEPNVKRHLEPLSRLKIVPNLQPVVGEINLIPAQLALDQEIIRIWKKKSASLAALSFFAKDLTGTNSFYMGRTVRWLARVKGLQEDQQNQNGILALDLGVGTTTVSAARGGDAGTMMTPHYKKRFEILGDSTVEFIRQCMGSEYTQQGVIEFLGRLSIIPGILPETVLELSIYQAIVRLRLQQALEKFNQNYPWLFYGPRHGLRGGMNSVIISGDVFTHAPTQSQLMMMLLDAIQPWGFTSFLMDRNQLLPLLGILGGLEPVLPVHILSSEAFSTLGTVISPVSNAHLGKTILSLEISGPNGILFSGDIQQGTLTHIDVPEGLSAKLKVLPKSGTDIGLEEPGMGGEYELEGGGLGLVVDARGRPIKGAKDDEERSFQREAWINALKG